MCSATWGGGGGDKQRSRNHRDASFFLGGTVPMAGRISSAESETDGENDEEEGSEVEIVTCDGCK